ncbi:Flp family type IVb pilin [Sphingomonas sp.]|uniref:Flp family type IVb pilin n=1 Tax=Sphingomonas sp. TaxID=28214 RepID=UPI0031E1B7C6
MILLRKMARDRRGATAIEYGLIAALIAVAAIAAMEGLGNSLGNGFNNISAKLNTATQ